MSTKSSLPLAPEEWDFRAIPAAEFNHAAWYEHARDNVDCARLWVKWMNSKLQLPLKSRYKITTVAEAFRRYYPHGLPNPYAQTVVEDCLRRSIPEELTAMGIAELFLRVPRYPLPWLSLPAEAKRNFLRLPVAQQPPTAFTEVDFRSTPTEQQFLVAVNFYREKKAIIRAFREWLDRKSKELNDGKFHTHKLRGGATAPRYAALTWLGAYRLARAHYTWRAAQELIRTRYGKGSAGPCRLPIINTSSRWSEVIKLAEANIKQLSICRAGWFIPVPVVSPFAAYVMPSGKQGR